VLPGEDFEGAVLAAERVRAAVRKPFKALFDVRLSVTISIGVTSFRPDVADAKTLIGEADQALYASKQGGRDRVTLFEAPRPAVVGG
jgi:two-component system cell cycle response regulator